MGHPLSTRTIEGWAAKAFAQVKEEPAERAGDTEQKSLPSGPSARSCAADALNAAPALTGCQPAPVRFVPQADLPAGMAYEQFIFETQQVPTRDGLHDFFNGLCWLHFPATKTRLNQLQAAQIAQAGIQQVRGPARDALTVFDENAAFFVGPDAVWDALVQKDWQHLFVTGRTAWSEVTLVLFGHALLEKLVYPRKPATAHVYRAQAAIDSIANLKDLDHAVAADLSADKLAAKPFAHLPILGVPGWWPGNEDPQFYADADVFRPPRRA
ncbi:MAG: DUF3025 domain-containing protein [Rhodoferax sp.]|nr:DUF3025 domain-containing protein [Rhodoferax sp.]